MTEAALDYLRRDDAVPHLYARAKVCDLPKSDDLDLLLEDLLAANFFWHETGGATLSLKDGAVYLTERSEAEPLEDEAARRAYEADFLRVVHRWQDRIALAANPDGAPDQQGEAV